MVFETDARRNTVRSGSTGRCGSSWAAPKPRAMAISPPETNTNTRPGICLRAISVGKNSSANAATAEESMRFNRSGSCADSGPEQARTAVKRTTARIPTMDERGRMFVRVALGIGTCLLRVRAQSSIRRKASRSHRLVRRPSRFRARAPRTVRPSTDTRSIISNVTPISGIFSRRLHGVSICPA